MKNQTLSLAFVLSTLTIAAGVVGCTSSAKKTEAVPAPTTAETQATPAAPAEKVVAANLGAASAGRSR